VMYVQCMNIFTQTKDINLVGAVQNSTLPFVGTYIGITTTYSVTLVNLYVSKSHLSILLGGCLCFFSLMQISNSIHCLNFKLTTNHPTPLHTHVSRSMIALRSRVARWYVCIPKYHIIYLP
jgi:hypothetical protein